MTNKEAIKELRNIARFNYTLAPHEVFTMAIEALKDQRPHGEWIPQDEFEAYNKCSICGIVIDNDFPIWRNFCPNCGSDMREEGE